MQINQLRMQQMYGTTNGYYGGYAYSPTYLSGYGSQVSVVPIGAPSAVGSPYGYGYGYGSLAPPSQPPQPPAPCYNNSTPQQCSYSPQQPSASSCSSGTWKATGSSGCISGWQCIPSNSGTGSTGGTSSSGPQATISCEPKVADAGMTLAISYSCANSTSSSGAGFSTGGALSGSATTTIAAPPSGYNTATYTLSCNNGSKSTGAQCSIQVGKPHIVFVADPPQILAGSSTRLGWITSGMSSCVISSPDLPDFASENAGYTYPNGAVSSGVLSADTEFLLQCTTVGGKENSATTSVTVL